MKPKYKVTGCARFFLFFIIFVPVVYFGAAYLRGEDGLQKLKNVFEGIVGTPKSDRRDTRHLTEQEKIDALERELQDAKEQVKVLEEELEKEKGN